MKVFYCCLLLFLSSCVTRPYFKSANDINKKEVTLYTRDKPARTGLFTVFWEGLYNANPPVGRTLEFIPDGKTGAENIQVGDIIGYSIDSSYYALKRLYFATTTSDPTAQLLFVKRLTREDSRIQLYELYESGRGNATGESKYTYFISLPGSGQYETINTRSSKLVPDFDLKMSAMVSDCPSLADKIRARQDGYFFSLVHFNQFKVKEVLTRIIDEYNGCK